MSLPIRSRSSALIFSLFLIPGTSLLGQAPPSQSTKKSLKDEMRMSWNRNDEWYFRHWLVLGDFVAAASVGKDPATVVDTGMNIDYLKEHGGEAAVHPTSNLEHHRPDGSAVRWRPHDSFHDYVDLGESSAGGMRGAGVAYAFTTFQRSAAGKALLTVGSDEGIRIWVNGKLVHDKQTRRPMTPDEDQIEVPVNAGDNTILVKLEQRIGPWTFSLRVLEPGAVLARKAEIGPSIVRGEPDSNVLIVQTDLATALVGEAPVDVEVVGAGGKVAARRTELRGRQVRFETGSWAEGAYEVRCSTLTLDKKPWSTHLPWFKGDALKEARELIAAAGKADTSKPSGFTLQMLADMVRDRLGEKLDAVPGNPWWIIHSPLMEYEELKQEAGGGPGPVRPYGFVRLAYRDEVDGSPQFCRAYLPAGYTADKKWPLVINLHGYYGANPPYVRWYWVDRRHVALNTEYADNHPVIVLEPHGRGNTSYLGLGEKDILRVLQMAKNRFSVDPDRVYLMGESMGGWGVWNIGTRHPDLFAAMAPIYGGSDYHAAMPEDALAKLTLMERFLQEKGSTFSKAESLLNLPIFIHHGDADQSVNVEYSRYVVRMLQRWGYDVRYREHPGGHHEDLKVANEIIDWFLEHKRNSQPRHVRIRSAELSAASAYWARVEQFSNPMAFMLLDAEVVGPNLVRLDTENVQAVTLSPGEPLIDPVKPIKVSWNGEAPRALQLTEGKVTLQAEGYQPPALRKSPQVTGPISDLMNTPFAVVVGTISADAQMRERCQQKADGFAAFWQDWQKQKPRLFRDKEISEKDAAAYSLLLIGGPEENLVTQKFANQLPLKIAPDSIQLGSKTFQASDAAVQMIYPHPLNLARYVSIVAGTTADGLYFWDPSDRGVWDWDIVIVDGWRPNSQAQVTAESRRILSGLWGPGWEIIESSLVLGNADLRAKGTLSKAPHLNASVDPALFKEYVGSYEIAPGFAIQISLEGNRLVLHAPGQPAGELLPESDTDFFVTFANIRMTFVKDSNGKVSSLTINVFGRTFQAQKVASTP